MKIVFATGNPHKLEEVNAIVEGSGIKFVLPPKGFDPVEDGDTFEDNSYIKAKAANELSHQMSLADDSGLCVDALNGAPGIYSARYAGSQQDKINKILSELESVENRSAHFVCCMTLLDKDGNMLFQTSGKCFGSIIKEAKGINGFGYDPIFEVEGRGITMAEMSEEEKNKISHRANALKQVVEFLSRKGLL